MQKRSEGRADVKKVLSPYLLPIYPNQVTSGTQVGFTGLLIFLSLERRTGVSLCGVCSGGLHFSSDCAISQRGTSLVPSLPLLSQGPAPPHLPDSASVSTSEGANYSGRSTLRKCIFPALAVIFSRHHAVCFVAETVGA